MARFLDFRSDTVTRPSQAMRDAMAAAEVGDDVLGDDPTVKRLEEEAAVRMGMEAGLFVPSGTMANQIALWVHSGRGGQVVCERDCHIALYEGGAAALLSGLTVRTIATRRGIFGPSELEAHVFPDDPHFAQTRVVALENTHNYHGGRCWSLDETDALCDAAHAHGARVHIDGARIFNAAVAQGLEARSLVRRADSVMFCLSKGLAAPVGSVLCGSKAFIQRARYVRKVLGGGMRQAGVLAAAGLLALENAAALAKDHKHARMLAKGLATIEGLQVDMDAVETNMVLVDTSQTGLMGEDFCRLMGDLGVGCLPRDRGPTARFVTHADLTSADVEEAVTRIAALFAEGLK